MNALILLLALGWAGDVPVMTTPVILAQQEDAFEFEPIEDLEPPPRRQSYLTWIFQALGIRYTLLFLLTGPLVFLGSLLVVAMCKRPGPIAAFFPFVAIPLLIGLYGFFDGTIAAFSVIATSASAPKPSEIAVGVSTALVTPLVGLLLTAPSYLILSIGLFVRSLLYREPSKESIYR